MEYGTDLRIVSVERCREELLAQEYCGATPLPVTYHCTLYIGKDTRCTRPATMIDGHDPIA